MWQSRQYSKARQAANRRSARSPVHGRSFDYQTELEVIHVRPAIDFGAVWRRSNNSPRTNLYRVNELTACQRPFANSLANVNATKALFAPVPVAMTMNCLPDLVRYVIGTAAFSYGTF